ncbi:hypothetical protein B0I26_12244 [Anoxybacillus vitaminiphilus]|uniref:Uncharacterized protein n=1 Tax=Paranoxybacillus vitaminiphilus TaxID=581036 RepID=A0A327Y4Z8_9BACL|nr:hypothetical protein [Anoxybacillus vitaminiphilus]RAK15352.1 hypothetical protein B0I26_12244 [Anoxybacillus vitaminiphilus]
MNKIVFSRNFIKKQHESRNNVHEILHNLEHETEGNVQPVKQHNSVHEILHNLQPETEVNVHVGEQTYDNAVFLAFDMNHNKASFLIDRFYKDGNRLTVLNSSDITSIDLPVSTNKDENADNEDE